MSEELKPEVDPFDTPLQTSEVFDKQAARNRLNSALGLDGENVTLKTPEEVLDKVPDPDFEEEDEVEIEDQTPVKDEKPSKTETEEDDFDFLDEDTDLDNDPTSEDDEEGEAFTEEELEELRSNDSKAVEQAREKGRLSKRLQAELDEAQLELASLREAKEAYEKQIEVQSNLKVDPATHPEFVKMRDSTASAILRQARSLPFALDTEKLSKSWGTGLTDLKAIDDLPLSDQDAGLNEYRLSLAKDLNLVDRSTEELSWDEDPEAMGQVNQIISIFQGQIPALEAMQEVYQKIQTKSKQLNLEVGYQEYQDRAAPYKSRMKALAALKEDEIDQDPLSIESLAAKKVQSSPEISHKYNKIVDGLTEVMLGARALSQEELDRLEATGKDMKEFHKNRERRVEELRNSWLPQIAALLVLKPDISSAMSDFTGKKAQENRDSARKKALRKVTSGKAPIPEPKKDEPKKFDKAEGLRNISAALGM